MGPCVSFPGPYELSALLLKGWAKEDYVFPVLCVVVARGAGGAVRLGKFVEPLFHGASVGSGPSVGGEGAAEHYLSRLRQSHAHPVIAWALSSITDFLRPSICAALWW